MKESHPLNPPAILFENVTFAYERTFVIVDASLTIPVGDLVCVIGPNAGGKSTLLKLMLGLLEPESGRIRLFGLAPREARPRVGYLPQHLAFDAQFPVTVMDVVLMGRLGAERTLGPYRGRARAISDQALRDVDMFELRNRPFSALSGGQRQRVLIARALACEPDLLLLDEPAAGLDINVEQQLYELLRELNQRLTIVMVSHDVTFVSTFVKTAICVNRTVHTHSSRQLSSAVIQELYGREVRVLEHAERARADRARPDHDRAGDGHSHEAGSRSDGRGS